MPFLPSPVLLFFVFYRLGRKVSLAERYPRVAGQLFAGGVLGAGTAYLFLPMLFGGVWEGAFPSFLSAVATGLGLLFVFVSFGLGTLFAGFVAIAVANFRERARSRTVPDSSPVPVL